MYIVKIDHFFYHGYIYRISVCFVFNCTVKVSIRNYTSTITATVHLEIDHFYHGYIYRISVCFIFPYTMKVSILNYTCTTRPSVHLEIDHVLSWLNIQDFRMFCISMYREGINTKLYLHYKTNCTS